MIEMETRREDGTVCGAHISDAFLYRLQLTRIWDESLWPLGVVMLNPSTADAFKDDPTIRKLMTIARAHGYGGIAVYNMAALRATQPDKLLESGMDVVGPDNPLYLRNAAMKHLDILVAWGSHKFATPERTRSLVRRLSARGAQLHCIGVNKDGNPKHPLYARNDVKLVPYPPRSHTL